MFPERSPYGLCSGLFQGCSDPMFKPQYPPILLANPDFYGTLAATRSLGSQAIPVYVAADRVLAVSRWSRLAARTLRCPPLDEPNRFLDWLGKVGERQPGIVLYPTSDEAAFLYALRADELSRNFRMYQPGLDSILHVLDKKRLYSTARQVGLETPETWFPETEADVARIGRDAPMPLLIKPRTQVLSKTHSKGVIVTRSDELVVRYREVVNTARYGRAVLEQFPDAGRPMIQAYLADAAERIYVLAAFVDRSGSLFAARAGMKIFQRPRRLGIGLCFQEAPLDQDIADGVRRLALSAGYYGLLQLEFIRVGERYLLIDYNPRFYNQLAFDVARGLHLPMIVYAAALGATDDVRRLVEASQQQPEDNGLVFCNGFGLSIMLTAQRLLGQMSPAQALVWRRWRADHDGAMIDPAVVPGDPLPAFVDMAAQLHAMARHPRAFLRKVVFDRTPA